MPLTKRMLIVRLAILFSKGTIFYTAMRAPISLEVKIVAKID